MIFELIFLVLAAQAQLYDFHPVVANVHPCPDFVKANPTSAERGQCLEAANIAAERAGDLAIYRCTSDGSCDNFNAWWAPCGCYVDTRGGMKIVGYNTHPNCLAEQSWQPVESLRMICPAPAPIVVPTEFDFEPVVANVHPCPSFVKATPSQADMDQCFEAANIAAARSGDLAHYRCTHDGSCDNFSAWWAPCGCYVDTRGGMKVIGYNTFPNCLEQQLWQPVESLRMICPASGSTTTTATQPQPTTTVTQPQPTPQTTSTVSTVLFDFKPVVADVHPCPEFQAKVAPSQADRDQCLAAANIAAPRAGDVAGYRCTSDGSCDNFNAWWAPCGCYVDTRGGMKVVGYNTHPNCLTEQVWQLNENLRYICPAASPFADFLQTDCTEIRQWYRANRRSLTWADIQDHLLNQYLTDVSVYSTFEDARTDFLAHCDNL